MKILHLITNQGGGAGIACLRLHHALREMEMESKVLSLFGNENKKENIFSLEADPGKLDFESILKKSKSRKYRQAWKIRLKGKPKELFSFPDSLWEIEDHPLVKEADVIHLHWIAGMIDIERFFSTVKKPIAWTIHDAWPFTGGFHYESYFNAKPFASISNALLETKRNAYAGKNITLIAPSRYLLNLCRASKVFKDQTHLAIPNSVPSAVYYPRKNRAELRARLGIKEHEQAWFFASGELDYFRKGADILLQAFPGYKNEKVKLFIAGKEGKQKFPKDPRIHFTGHIANENQFAEILNACDALIHTSREDNFPNMILESLFCGTPVLSIDKGGVSEMIRNGVNGILIGEDQLQEGFEKIIRLNYNREAIASTAQQTFSSEVQAARFKNLYHTISNFICVIM
jgi:glycosyltransferase involved in cell wall biosynthesis